MCNGRSFADPPSSAFEVPHALGLSVLQVLRAGTAGCRVSSLAAISGENRDDLLDFLELLTDSGVLIEMKPERPPKRAGGGES